VYLSHLFRRSHTEPCPLSLLSKRLRCRCLPDSLRRTSFPPLSVTRATALPPFPPLFPLCHADHPRYPFIKMDLQCIWVWVSAGGSPIALPTVSVELSVHDPRRTRCGRLRLVPPSGSSSSQSTRHPHRPCGVCALAPASILAISESPRRRHTSNMPPALYAARD
jgi:hypothetical protein